MMFVCLLRVALGPHFSDRIAAADMLSMKIILLMAVLALIIGESYLVDICLIFAVVDFLSIVFLTRSITERDMAGDLVPPAKGGNRRQPEGGQHSQRKEDEK
ncbi:MAG: hypothetical protein IJU31_02845 [Synergistaceae bacterium]|nr:hypothetical protein [Synergistaceae bacterium]